MKRFTQNSPSLVAVVLAALAVVTALALSSCSRSGVADSLTGPGQGGAVAFAKGPGQGGAPPPPPPVPPPPAADPCVSLAGFGGTIVPVAASVPQNRAARLRIEVQGDVAAGTLNTIGSCATPVSFISGRATVSGSGGLGVSEAFGALAAVPGEAGVVLATAANGDVLEIIWPGLAGCAPAAPIIRVQLARSGQAGSTLSVTASVTARTANGATATFNAAASGLVIPALK